MELYRVDLERVGQSTFFVLGDTKEAAEEDARIFAEEMQDEEIDWQQYIDLLPVDSRNVPPDAEVWTGGPGGDWTTIGELSDV